MKKRLIIFSVAIMAFLAMPLLRVSAASATASGKLGKYGVYGAVNIYEGSANASVGCDLQGAIVTVTLKYDCINDDTNMVESNYSTGYGCGGVTTSQLKPQGNYRSDKATATYYVRIEKEYTWTPQSQTVLYSSP